MKKLLFLLLTLLPIVGFSQEIIVKSFKEASATSLAKTTGDIPKTNEGEDAAVVIVKVHDPNLTFEGRILTDEQHPEIVYQKGEYVLYLAPRSKTLTIKIPGFKDEKVNVADYERTLPDGLQSRRAYELYLQVIPKSMVGGRNFAWGISGGYLMPMISESADGYAGSPINYGNGTALEEADYTGAQGFVAGVNFDIRLHKNFYINAGLNFGQYRYKNAFSGKTMIYPQTNAQDLCPAYAKYKESYLQSFLEVPIYLSYRFPTSRRSNLQVGLGPVISYGLSAKMKFNGVTMLEEGYLSPGGDLRSYNYSGDFNLYGQHLEVNERINFSDNAPIESVSQNQLEGSPLKPFNLSAGIYLGYEIYGVMLSVHYQYMLTNMANSSYWDQRYALHYTPDNYMTGTKIRHNYLQFKIGYTLRY